MIRLVGAATLVISTSSCARFGEAVVESGMSMVSNNQIMLVRSEPPSFGFQRLAMQARTHADLELFVKQKGLPNFLAETHNRERHYFILYYLAKREAFACRTRAGGQSVEFAGPYPITDREYQTLDAFRRNSAAVR
jgi:hypothetical protein